MEDFVRGGRERWYTNSLCEKWNREGEMKHEIVSENKYKRFKKALMKAREAKNTEGENLEGLIVGVTTLN